MMIDKRKRLKKGQRVAELAVWLEGGLVIAKTAIGLLSGSLALVSDAIHSASDFVSIITSWLGLKIAQKEADKRFPYGYYKAENLGTLIISFLIIYASWEMFSEGYGRLFSLSSIKIPLLALGISLFDALILFFFGNYEIKIGKKVGAQSLVAMGEENRMHIFSSTAIFVGTLAAFLKIPYVEGIVTIGIAFLILKIGFKALKNSTFALMDVSPGEATRKRVIATAEKISGVEEIFDLRLRRTGPFIFGEAKVGVRKSVGVKRGHQLADKVEREIIKKVPQVESFIVHVEPFKSDWHHLAIPIKAKKGLKSSIAGKFGRAPYFLFVNLKKDKIKGFYILKNPHKGKKAKAGLWAAKLITKQKSDVLITPDIGEIAFYTLRENLVDICQAKAKTAKEAIRGFIKGKLEVKSKV